MQLTQIRQITGTLLVKTGLHIGAGDTEMRIGGTDNPVTKNPFDGQPCIPGSSLKGKIRSLLEWQLGLVMAARGHPFSFQHLRLAEGAGDQASKAQQLLKLFGGAPGGEVGDIVGKIGPTRLAFWDCPINEEWLALARSRNLASTETKSENTINRISGVAEHPRFTERVIAGAEFDFRLSLKVIDGENLLPLLLDGLKLLELDSLGGSGSRGYGKIAFKNLCLDGKSIDLPATPFAQGEMP